MVAFILLMGLEFAGGLVLGKFWRMDSQGCLRLYVIGFLVAVVVLVWATWLRI